MYASPILSQPVLVLNKNWQPFRIVKAAEAIADLFTGKFEVVENWEVHDFTSWAELSKLKDEIEKEDHIFVGSVNCRIAVPKVVRSLRAIKNKSGSVRLSRRNLYLRDNNCCQYSGVRLPTTELNIDHVIPSSRGGKSTWDNLVCCSIEVNQRKGNRTPEEAGLTLLRKPKKPSQYQLLMASIKNPPEEWKDFISDAYWNVDISDNP